MKQSNVFFSLYQSVNVVNHINGSSGCKTSLHFWVLQVRSQREQTLRSFSLQDIIRDILKTNTNGRDGEIVGLG